MSSTSHADVWSAEWVTSCAFELGVSRGSVENCLELLEQGDSVVFIARYRKEKTEALDEVQISQLSEKLEALKEFEKRKAAIVSSLIKRELLTEDLSKEIQAVTTLPELEDIYLPHRPKRTTRASIARDKGLEPLAGLMMKGNAVNSLAFRFLSSEHEVATVDEAIAGARDIVAEQISEDRSVREKLREYFARESVVHSAVIGKNREDGDKFRDYFDWQEPVRAIAGHRLLALFRGEAQKVLKLTFRPEQQRGIRITGNHLRKDPEGHLKKAVEDGYDRLLAPSMEKELRRNMKQRADEEAIEVFAENLRSLLLAPALGQKRVMALDPGFTSGAKLVCLNEQGDLLHHDVIFPTHGEKRAREAGDRVKDLVAQYAIAAIAIGSGTAGRETERFVRQLGLDEAVIITLVNEDGASIYSASETARLEFPDHDITVRGAVSIGRRLQDPLAELVKITPKSLGVGQYQHDVDQKLLQKRLDEVVVSCVNRVGVELNSASIELLTHVSGLGPVLAKNIVDWRSENGPFTSRRDLLKVARLGAKVFEQCAGFLRVRNSTNILDNTGVHPERYALVKQMAGGLGLDGFVQSVRSGAKIDLAPFVDDETGMATLEDIIGWIAAEGRDPRAEYVPFRFDETVQSMEDLHLGMVLPAVITNVTKFGAFADIGLKQDGLIHISQLADRFIKDPGEVVKVKQQVMARVIDIDPERGRIGLSLKKGNSQ